MRMRSAIGAAVLGLALAGASGKGCGSGPEQIMEAQPPNGIIGGEPTNFQEWQGVLALSTNPGVNLWCSSNLIDPEVLITAGHCANNYPITDYVVAGGVQAYTVLADCADSVTHSGWAGSPGPSAVDLKMIKLATPVTRVENYPVRQSPAAKLGDKGKIVGYGLSANGGDFYDFIHRVGDVNLLNLNNNIIEVGNPAGACQNDSGGGFFTEQTSGTWVLTGVASYITPYPDPDTSDCASTTSGTFYTNTLKFRSWIDAQMKTFTGHGLEETTDTDPGSDSDTDSDSDSDGDSDADSDSDADGDDDDDDDDNDDNDDNDNNDDNDDIPRGNGSGCNVCPTSGKSGSLALVDLLAAICSALR